VVLLAGCAGAGGEPGDAAPSGGLLAFRDAREVIPGSLVRSANVRLPKSLGAKRVWVHSGGDAEMLLVNGEPVGRSARIRPGSRVAIAVRGPQPGEKAAGTVRVGATTSTFNVAGLRRPPATKLTFSDNQAKPGQTAYSRVVAPASPGGELKVEGAKVMIETKEGRFRPPHRLASGEPFRLIAKVPEDQKGPLRAKVSLGREQAVWRVRIP
jgi:hypothetical protein